MSKEKREHHTDKKPVELTVEEKIKILQDDVKEVARGVNVQARLLDAIVKANDYVLQVYLEITKVKQPKEGEQANPKVVEAEVVKPEEKK